MTSHLRGKRRADALFRALSSDFLLREQFVTDPAQVLSEYVSGERLEPETSAAVNHLVYAMVSNPQLLQWLQTYEHGEHTDEEFAAEFARAVARDGDAQTLLAIMRGAREPQDMYSVQADVLRKLIAALERPGGSVFAGTEKSSPGTEKSPGVGTDKSPGQVFSGTEMSSPGTEKSPGVGTDKSPGQVFSGTEMSSPGTEISPGPGTEISSGQVFSGTEMSSPGTEFTPGTMMSPGHLGEVDTRVTLNALVDFAHELRRAGALDTVRFR